jgi:hypothetical protein
VAANVLDRKFDVAEANRVWACDITYESFEKLDRFTIIAFGRHFLDQGGA